ncbi:hypothetical protein K1719_037131 [Acacia pycnantha]|nr:hypothetical protein K1719_037131 [Acacia pycnantha]
MYSSCVILNVMFLLITLPEVEPAYFSILKDQTVNYQLSVIAHGGGCSSRVLLESSVDCTVAVFVINNIGKLTSLIDQTWDRASHQVGYRNATSIGNHNVKDK